MEDNRRYVTISFGGLVPLLQVAFIVLRLCNVITWPWVLVLAPVLIPVALGVLLFIVIGIILGRLFLKK